MSMPRDLAHLLLDALFPPRCVACGASGALLCASCLAGVSAPTPPLCPLCGRSVAPSGNGDTICALCAAGHRPMALAGLRVAVDHDGAIRTAMLAFKYRGRKRLAEPLGDLLVAELRRWELAPDLIVTIPLHVRRRRERGYNQADLLARRAATRLGVPYLRDTLIWRRETPPQVGLSAAERRANVRDAFALAQPRLTAVLAGKRIVLIDDVTTTGSTLDAAAAALVTAGPVAVYGLAVARPSPHDDYASRAVRGAAARTSAGRAARA
ncbi:MAG TPA: ComF family protein [Ktedonobacterales bacterium]|nr:ComF family protein [Ktedonobacterales bacterium]